MDEVKIKQTSKNVHKNWIKMEVKRAAFDSYLKERDTLSKVKEVEYGLKSKIISQTKCSTEVKENYYMHLDQGVTTQKKTLSLCTKTTCVVGLGVK